MSIPLPDTPPFDPIERSNWLAAKVAEAINASVLAKQSQVETRPADPKEAADWMAAKVADALNAAVLAKQAKGKTEEK